jgi:hypothetical protein
MQMKRAMLCCAALLLAASSASAAPIALEKWGRYHVKITPYMQHTSPPPGKQVKWVPKVELVFRVTSPESDDIIELQHYRGRRKWGPVQKCQIPSRGIIKRRGPGGKPMGYSFVAVTCMMDEKLAISKTGRFSVKVSYKQTGAGKLHRDLATYGYVVKHYNSNWLSKRGPIKAYYVDHDFRMGETWLYRKGDGQLQIWAWFKYDRKGEQAVRGARLRCFVGDKKLKFYDNPTRRTTIDHEHYTGNNKHSKITWGLWYWWTARVDGKTGAEWIKAHPGKYRCTLTQLGEVAREIRFEVGADGAIKRAPCHEAKGDRQVRAIEDSFLIASTFKKNADLKFDKRAYARSPLYGRKWGKGCPPK